MVRIPLIYGGEGLFASALVYNNLMRAPGVVNLLVDTGATVTLLSPNDQARLGIDPSRLGLRRSERRISTIAGKANAFKLPDCLISLPCADHSSRWVDLEVPGLLLLEHRSGTKGKALRARSGTPAADIRGGTPSLLGRDVLEMHGLRLLVDFKRRTAFLETADDIA